MAEKQHRIALLYGDSIFLMGLAESLRSIADLEIVQANPQLEPASLADAQPDVVVVDAAQVTPSQLDELMTSFPPDRSPPILRMNANSKHLTVVSAQQYPAVNLTDLTQVLNNVTIKKQLDLPGKKKKVSRRK